MNMDDTPLLEVNDLEVAFETDEGRIQAADGVSFQIEEGEAFGLVGESGAGKSVTAMSLMQLIQTPPGEISAESVKFQGRDILEMSQQELRSIRGGEVSMIFQDPSTSLNPVHKVGKQIAEAVTLHSDATEEEGWEEAVDMLERVGIPDPEERAHEYPHQFSGGMQQRAMIAMAIINRPSLLIADEPTTALDVTIEANILELIDDIQEDYGMSILLITHDLSVISEVCDRVGVMYAGEMVEVAPVKNVFDEPQHPYTEGLLNSIPTAHEKVEHLATIEGQMPGAGNRPSGCRFRPRCPAAMPECADENPEMRETKIGEAACLLHPSPPSTPGSAAQVDTDLELLDRLSTDTSGVAHGGKQ